MPDVSIIIISWNARRYLLECLRSIGDGLRRHQAEVIVVDNQSGDGSAEAVERQFADVILIRNARNEGFARGNNIGIERSTGRYVCLVNSDVTILPGCIDLLIDYLDRHPEIGMVGPKVLNTDGSLQYSYWNFPTVLNTLGRTFALDTLLRRLLRWPARPHLNGARNPAHPVDVLSGCFLLIRREALEQVGLLDDGYFMYGEDMDLCRRFQARHWGLRYYSAARAIHAGGASSANAPVRFFLEMQKANLRYWGKHHGRFGYGFYLLSALLHHLLRLIPQAILYCFRPSRREAIRPKLQRSTACIDWLLHGSPGPAPESPIKGGA